MNEIFLYNRITREKETEKVYKKDALVFLYEDNFFSKLLLMIVSKISFFSKLYGFYNSLKITSKKIKPFIKSYQINEDEFLKKTSNFTSFNDFFIRVLKTDARPIVSNENAACLPVDGRYLVFPKISQMDSFYIKGQKLDLKELLQDEDLYQKYKNGSMVLGRLAPSDYHRFHFPCDCIPDDTKLINGSLFSVNPIALRKNIKILSENKRTITLLKTKVFSDILYIEIGATNVGSIHQTFIPNTDYTKGEEKGYFSLGSSVVLLFEENKIKFDSDLIQNSKEMIETKALFGQSLGKVYCV